MIDLETFGTATDAAILSIGAVEFDLVNGITRYYHERISIDSCTSVGLKIDGKTVLWWLGQSDEARASLINAPVVHLAQALSSLATAFDWQGAEVWCNGASFDFAILKTAYAKLDQAEPWRYYNECDYRTLKNLVPLAVYHSLKVEPATAHDALEDAIAQAQTAINILNYLEDSFVAARLIAQQGQKVSA